MSERENILGRVREALRLLAPEPRHSAHGGRHGLTGARESSPQPFLPAVGGRFDEQLALFQKNAADLKAVLQVVKGQDGLCRKLLELRDCEGWKKIGIHAGRLTDGVSQALGLPICR